MKAIIIAGGEGKRLRPLTDNIPKPMILIGGKPILEHTINLLKKHGVTEFIIALCYLPEPIINYFGNGSRFGITITYTFEDPNKPLGTAGALLPAKELIRETCIVTYADTLRNLDVSAMIEQHSKSNSIVTINTYKHSGENYKSKLEFNSSNTLLSFTELETSTKLPKGETVWSNGSFYIIEPELLTYIDENKPTDFAKDIFKLLLQEKRNISVFPSSQYFIDIGTFETLKQVEDDLQQNKISS